MKLIKQLRLLKRYRVNFRIVQYRTTNVWAWSEEHANAMAVRYPRWILDRAENDDVRTWIRQLNTGSGVSTPASISFLPSPDETSQ